MRPFTRRTLFYRTAALAGMPALSRASSPASPGDALELRKLGGTGRELPCLGLGCFPLGNLADEEEAIAIVRRAHESGARYFDTAPSYASGESERLLDKALRGLAREELFVATKTLARDGDGALADLEGSLERLGLDYVDSVQIHAVASSQDLDRALAPDGAVKALESAREKKKLRHVGVTGHFAPAFLLEAIERHPFATALVPVNPLDTLHESFVRGFLPRARAKGVAVIAMKIYAGGHLASKAGVSAGDLVRFALAQEGVAVAVPGADSLAHWDEALGAALRPAPDAAEQEQLIRACGPHAGRSSEWYKTP